MQVVNVFAGAGGLGGNPAPIVLDASAMSAQEMMQLAAATGHESGFVLPPENPASADYRMRFFVPRHEMEMCGHATVGALWCLRQAGRWRELEASVETRSGLVRGFVRHAGTPRETIEITQPAGRLESVDGAGVDLLAGVLNITPAQMLPLPVYNASTSRVKTLIGLQSVEALDRLAPDFARIESACERIGSTGLYPFAIGSEQQRVFHARQFPKSSGYPEDAATGIAAAALLFGLRAHRLVRADEGEVTIHQGRAMGQPSEIVARFRLDGAGEPAGCFIGGKVVPAPARG